MLTSLVLIPVLGCVAVATLGRDRDKLAVAGSMVVAGAVLGLASWAPWASALSDTSTVETHAWIPALGVSLLFGAEGLSLILVAWVALTSFITLAMARPDSRTASWILFLEAMLVALFFARDVFLILASVGGIAIAISLLTSTPRRVLMVASAGLTVLLGWFAWLYRMAYLQTGFVSTELARWQGLVLFPDEARCLFLVGSFGCAWMMLALALAANGAPRASRLFLSTTGLLFGGYFVARVLMPLSGLGAEAVASAGLVLAALLMASTFFAREWTWVAVGYQGLVLFGLFSFREADVAGALLMMMAAAVGGFGVGLTRAKSVVWFFVAFLIGLPLFRVVVPAWEGDTLFAAVGTAAFAVLAHRIIVLASAPPSPLSDVRESRSALWFAVPVVAWSISMVIGWSSWESRVTPWARDVLSHSSSELAP